MRVIHIVGTRPQFIKLAVLSKAIHNFDDLDQKIIHTGQHFSHFMSDDFFQQLEIPKPDYHLNVNSSSHGAMTGQMLIEIEQILLSETLDYIIVYGDCNTTLAGALAASKLNIPIAHVESGLRSFNRQMPEEINRVLVDQLSTILWVPTKTGLENLKQEGLTESPVPRKVILTGDLMLELLDMFTPKIVNNYDVVKNNHLDQYYVLTVHRQDNTVKDRLTHLFKVISKIQKEITVVFPMHPRVSKVLERNQISVPDNIKIIQPLGYLDMMSLVYHSQLVLTDSGGLQKESVHLKKPTIILREQTEWVENLATSYAKLIPIDDLKISEFDFPNQSNLVEQECVDTRPSNLILNSLLN